MFYGIEGNRMLYGDGNVYKLKDLIMTIVETGFGRRILKMQSDGSQLYFDEKEIEKICFQDYDLIKIQKASRDQEALYTARLNDAEKIDLIIGQGEFDEIGAAIELIKLGHFDDICGANYPTGYLIDDVYFNDLILQYQVKNIGYKFDEFGRYYYTGQFIPTDPNEKPTVEKCPFEDITPSKNKGVDSMTYEEMIEMPKTIWTEDEACEELIKRGFADTILTTTPGGDVIDEMALANLLFNEFEFKISGTNDKGHDIYEGTFPPVATNFTQHYDL